jgi:dTDP-4-dehydrorhamnose reductase
VIQPKVELWGGIEASIVRVADEYRDQCADTGHSSRPGDLEAIAALGIRTLRYPFLWEKCAPSRPDCFEWDWCDRQAKQMETFGIAPVAGLLHHGSGPRYTQLADPAFPLLFQAFATQVAVRYPWISKWTPINEPLTTARFSGLYGIWYPHARNEAQFWAMLLNQIDAVRLAMAAIRKIRPDAELIQTEDLGQILSTPDCAEEAKFQNARRWLTWDLLCGTVDKHHPMWTRISSFGYRDRLLKLRDNPCTPDILGINHYLTSNRFLDGRRPHQGGYDDIEAVRVHAAPPGHETMLNDAWNRYRLPLAITEVHNGCTRDEQMRWTLSAWNAALRLNQQGVPVRAVTVWALLGCMDWASLLTRREEKYEVGVFDVRGGNSRPTAVAKLVKNLAMAVPLAKNLQEIAVAPGWWMRPVRFSRMPYGTPQNCPYPRDGSPILVVGRGRLGSALKVAADLRGLPVCSIGRPAFDLSVPDGIEEIIKQLLPWAIINAAAYNGVERSERNPELCFAVNTSGAAAIARACADKGIACVTCSSDLIFEGRKGYIYRESDQPAPINVYGRSKAEAERQVLAFGGRQLIIRSAGFFGAPGRRSLVSQIVRRLGRGGQVALPDDRIFTPSYLPDVANTILDLLIDDEVGIWHLSNGQPVSWRGLAMRLCGPIGANREQVIASRPRLGSRCPPHTPLGSEKAVLLPSLDNALGRLAFDFSNVAN